MEEENEELVGCSVCDSEADDLYTTINNNKICGDCMAVCERCDDIFDNSDNFCTVDGYQWCEYCTQDNATWCENCEEFTSAYTNYISNRSEHWCEDCTSNYAYWCDGCDEYNSDVCGCDDSDESAGGVIHDYGYRPDPIFHATQDNEKLYFGLEIEMESAGEDYGERNTAANYAYRLEDNELAYLKGDGSLSCGFELVTHPMTHEFYKNEADELWSTIEHLRTMGMRSHDTRTCGIHIHISRSGFNGAPHTHRFLNLVYSNQPLFQKLAGRKSDRWATFEDVMTTKATEDGWVHKRSFADKVNNGRNTNRYSAVNTQNRHTLEMRIFKGNLNTETIKAHLDLAHASVEYTRVMTIAQVKNGALSEESFLDYVLTNNDLYPHLNARVIKLYNPATI